MYLDMLEHMTAAYIASCVEPLHDFVFCDVYGNLTATLKRIDDELGPWKEHIPTGAVPALQLLGRYVSPNGRHFLPIPPGATATELRQIADANVELALVRQAAAIRAEELSYTAQRDVGDNEG